jgi:tRNA pseudouridine synthase B
MDFLTGETLLIDKPYKWTSFDVVKRIRTQLTRRYGLKKMKVGHAGTLDPLATGLMIVVTGRSTKLIEQLQAGEKEYVATLALGATTPSFDLETEIDATYPTAHITRQLVEEKLSGFIGRIEQVPPTYSAIKIGGKRAYHFAREGEEVELKPKVLEITSIDLIDFAPDSLTLKISCSKGTYIRALARDIGRALGSGAHLTALRRTRIGDYRVDDALNIDQIGEFLNAVAITLPENPDLVPEKLRKRTTPI